jgi:cytochrome c oxidase assembly factor CtaG
MSPLATGSHRLFSAHMVQHMVLINWVAPLLVVADPGYGWMWAAPRPLRRGMARWWRRQQLLRRVVGWVTSPAAAWTLFAAALWLWHIPRLYQAALVVPWVHELEHLAFLGTAVLFWWRLLEAPGKRGAAAGAAYGTGILMSFTTMLHSGMLGALITFSPMPWYPNYITNTAAWGIGALADQQLAGVIMWVPGGTVYLVVTVVLLAKWLRRMEQADRQQAGLVARTVEPG